MIRDRPVHENLEHIEYLPKKTEVLEIRKTKFWHDKSIAHKEILSV